MTTDDDDLLPPPLHTRLVRCGALDADAMPAHGLPWWLQLLQTAAAWLAALLAVSGFLAIFLSAAESGGAMIVIGSAVLFGALAILQQPASFIRQTGVPLSLAGQLLIAGGLLMLNPNGNWHSILWLCATLAAALTWPNAPSLHRVLCACVALGCALFALDDNVLRSALLLLCASTAVALFLLRVRWAGHRHAPLLRAWLHACAAIALLGPWINDYALIAFGLHMPETIDPPLLAPRVLASLACLLPIATTAWLAWRRQVPFRAAGLLAMLALSVTAWWIPGAALALALLLAAWQACDRPWSALAALALVAYVSLFYYHLAATLLFKSALLATAGLVLLALALVRRATRSRSQQP